MQSAVSCIAVGKSPCVKQRERNRTDVHRYLRVCSGTSRRGLRLNVGRRGGTIGRSEMVTSVGSNCRRRMGRKNRIEAGLHLRYCGSQPNQHASSSQEEGKVGNWAQNRSG